MVRLRAALCLVFIVLPLVRLDSAAPPPKSKLPTAPKVVSPLSGATNVSTSPTLSWSSRSATSYDVYFGTTMPLPLVSLQQTATSYTPAAPLANGTTYYWQIVAFNTDGSISGAVWSFSTVAAAPVPTPPGAPGSPSPSAGATNVSTSVALTWSAAGATSYTVNFGTSDPPPIVATGVTSASYAPSGMTASTTYYWQVVAINSAGSTTGPVWSFSTAASPKGGKVWTVAGGGDFQGTLNSAKPGDTILLQAGATFTGNFVLPAKAASATSYITIRSSADAALLPPSGVRITPAYAPQLPKVKSPNGSPALATANYAHHYRIELVEFLANSDGWGDILTLGDGSSAQNSLSVVPHDLIVDRVYLHGDATVGQKRGIALNSATTTIQNSYISDIKSSTQDSQAICGWNGPGPYTITNNYLEAAGENVLFGGADPAILDLVPSDIVFTRNRLAKPLSWVTQNWMVKNLFELKNAQRVTIDGNVMEYNWEAAQAGYAVVLTPRNQDGTAPWSIVQHVTFSNNIVRHVSSAFNLLGTDNEQSSQVMNDVTIRNNLFVDVSAATYGNAGRLLLINGGVNITFDHNTVFNDGLSTVYAYGTPVQGFVFTNNIMPANSYGIMGDSASPGTLTTTTYFPNALLLDNIIVGAPPSSYPTGNYYPATMSDVGFADYAGGNYRLSNSSPYRSSATDGTDVGANIDAVNAAAGTTY